ncbi:MAG: oligosaccharide flippase family protein [Peptostreptococcaceae bacterium]
MKQKRKKLILNALLLTISTMTFGIVNMIFRVYLSNKIGAEGMGLFQLIMSINVVATTLAVSGIRVTMTRLVAEELGKNNNHKIKNLVNKGVIYSLFFGILAAIILYNNAEFISNVWIKDSRAIISLKILSLSLPFVSICCCFAGYFYGVRKVMKSVTADIVEISTMMMIIYLFIGRYLPMGLDYTCSLISVSMAMGAMFSAFYSYLLFAFEKKVKSSNNSKNKASVFDIGFIAVPIACSSYVQTSLRTAEDILIPSALRQFGSSTSSSLSIFGMVKGMVMPLINFPSIFLASFSTLIIPEISEASALHKNKMVNYILSKVFKFTLLISLFSTGLFMIYSQELGVAIYKSEEVGVMIKILAPLIPFMYLDRIVDGSLNALNQQMYTLKYNLMDMVLRISIILVIIPKKGIDGFILVLFASTLFNASLSINRLLKVTKLEFDLIDWVIKPIICITISSYLTKFIFNLINLESLILLQVIVDVILYLVILFMIKCIRIKDIKWFTDAFKNDIKKVDYNSINIYKQL